MARYDERRVAKLLGNAGIVRNRLKIESAIANARAFEAVRKEYGSFDRYLWGFVDGRAVQNQRRGMGDVPATTKESDAMSKDLRRRGFRFVGSTICYAFMQSAGMVNDHQVGCFRYAEVAGL
jgi:DNA-3-methyladenine glycosylase I